MNEFQKRLIVDLVRDGANPEDAIAAVVLLTICVQFTHKVIHESQKGAL